MKIPNSCKECRHVGAYTTGPFARNPHYCCELIWELHDEDYKVDPDKIDPECPLNNKHLQAYFEELNEENI